MMELSLLTQTLDLKTKKRKKKKKEKKNNVGVMNLKPSNWPTRKINQVRTHRIPYKQSFLQKTKDTKYDNV